MATPILAPFTFPNTIAANDPEMQKELAIANGFRPFIEAAAKQFGFQPCVIAGIGSRESGWGLSSLLKPSGPSGTGDRVPRHKPNPPLRPGPLPPDGLGFGRGLMQLDFDSNSVAQHGNWQDPQTNISAGCQVLAQKLAFVQKHTTLQGLMLLRGAIAAYNCGEGTIRDLPPGADIDSKTANGNYSADVLNLAGFFQLNGWA
jgi:soluble lytic murein transglycosylase-like protein